MAKLYWLVFYSCSERILVAITVAYFYKPDSISVTQLTVTVSKYCEREHVAVASNHSLASPLHDTPAQS